MSVLGPNNHGLLRLYRFKDSELEGVYRAQSDEWCLHPVRLHAYALFALCLLSCLSYVGGQLKLGFWMYVATGSLAVTMLLATHLSPTIQRHIVPFHAVLCCVLAILFSVMIPVQYEAWRQDVANLWRPHLQALPSGTAYGDVEAYLEHTLAAHSVLLALVWAFAQWLPLALTGLNGWTVLAYGCTLGLFLTFAFTCPCTTAVGSVNVACLACGSTVAFASISIVLEQVRRSNFLAHAQLAQELHASHLANSILNHTLKNILADVAANLEVFLTGTSDTGPALLQDCITQLRQGMQSCKDRQVYLKLTAGEYQSVPTAVRLSDLTEPLVAGRAVTLRAPDTEVILDSTLITLILENALSNAFQHGCPENPDVCLTIDDSVVIPATMEAPGQRRLRFTITNAVDPSRPRLTPEFIDNLFNGKVATHPTETVSPLAYHIGLSHCALAARRGGIQLTLTEEGGRVAFTAALAVPLPPGNSLLAPGAEADHLAPFPPPTPLPPGLCFCCIDDSLAAQKLLDLHIRRKCPNAVVHCFGATEDDVARFMALAVSQADVVILDQHLEAANVMTYGTDLVCRLLSLGYQGLVCIRSANDAAEDRLKYTASGAHCFFGKDVPGSRMMDELAAAYASIFAFDSPSSSMGLLRDVFLFSDAADVAPPPDFPASSPAPGSKQGIAYRIPDVELHARTVFFPDPCVVHFSHDGLLSLPGMLPEDPTAASPLAEVQPL